MGLQCAYTYCESRLFQPFSLDNSFWINILTKTAMFNKKEISVKSKTVPTRSLIGDLRPHFSRRISLWEWCPSSCHYLFQPSIEPGTHSQHLGQLMGKFAITDMLNVCTSGYSSSGCLLSHLLGTKRIKYFLKWIFFFTAVRKSLNLLIVFPNKAQNWVMYMRQVSVSWKQNDQS